MLKAAYRIGVAFAFFFIFVIFAGALRAEEWKLPAANVKEIYEGVYKIIQMDREIGSETFKKTIYDNNTIVFESRIEMSVAGVDTFKENTSLVVEEDSYFPKSYYSRKIARQFEQETSIAMFANVGVITSKTNEGSETTTRVFLSGSICLQPGIAHQLEQLLMRYNDSIRGMQSLMVFDPISQTERSLGLEHAGVVDSTIGGSSRRLDLYKIRKGQRGELMLYVDQEGNVVRVVDSLQRMEFILSKLKSEGE